MFNKIGLFVVCFIIAGANSSPALAETLSDILSHSGESNSVAAERPAAEEPTLNQSAGKAKWLTDRCVTAAISWSDPAASTYLYALAGTADFCFGGEQQCANNPHGWFAGQDAVRDDGEAVKIFSMDMKQDQNTDRYTYVTVRDPSRNCSSTYKIVRSTQDGKIQLEEDPAVQIEANEPEPSVADEAYQNPNTQPAYADPYGFVAWLNQLRAQYGRGPVSYDPNLSAWAESNNGQQLARGMGHHQMGTARRQNAGWGSAAAVWNKWVASPGHASALLDPSTTMVGIANNGPFWTFNGN
jgi:uncharacterized protein YkwD